MNDSHLVYLYLLSPLHTGGTSQEGNVVGIARETHTELPYLPSSTIRGRLRAATLDDNDRKQLWGNTLEDVTQRGDPNLQQGDLWVGDAALLWFPVPSLSHGLIWVTSPFLLRRWLRSRFQKLDLPPIHSFSGGKKEDLYLRDAVFRASDLNEWQNWRSFIPQGSEETNTIARVFVLGDRDCSVLIQSSLWRQVKIKLDNKKTVDGGFRYEEAVPPETLMYFPWGTTTAKNGSASGSIQTLKDLLADPQHSVWQFGGQESLGRGLVELWNEEEE